MTIQHDKSRPVVNLRADLDTLKEDVSTLAQHALEAGVKNASYLRDDASARLDELKETGLKNLSRLEKRIREKPGQSVAIALAAGAVLSLLFGRK